MPEAQVGPQQTKTSTRDLGDIRQRLTVWMAKTLGPGAEPCLSELSKPVGSDMSWQENSVKRPEQ